MIANASKNIAKEAYGKALQVARNVAEDKRRQRKGSTSSSRGLTLSSLLEIVHLFRQRVGVFFSPHSDISATSAPPFSSSSSRKETAMSCAVMRLCNGILRMRRGTSRDVNIMFVAMMRTAGLNVRLIALLEPTPVHPPKYHKERKRWRMHVWQQSGKDSQVMMRSNRSRGKGRSVGHKAYRRQETQLWAEVEIFDSKSGKPEWVHVDVVDMVVNDPSKYRRARGGGSRNHRRRIRRRNNHPIAYVVAAESDRTISMKGVFCARFRSHISTHTPFSHSQTLSLSLSLSLSHTFSLSFSCTLSHTLSLSHISININIDSVVVECSSNPVYPYLFH